MAKANLDVTASIAKYTAEISKLDDVTGKEAAKAAKRLESELGKAYKAAERHGKAAAKATGEAWNVALGSLLADAAKASGAAIFDMGKQAFETADNIGKLAADTGLSIETLDTLRARALGTEEDFGTLTESLRAFGKKLNDFEAGGGRAAKTLKALGIELKDNEGKARDTDAVFRDVIDGLSGVEDESRRLAMAYEIAGTEGGKLARLLADGKFAAHADAMRQIGLSTAESAMGTAMLSDALNKVSIAAGAAANAMNTQFSGAIGFIIDRSLTAIIGLKNAWGAFIDWGEKNLGGLSFTEAVLARTKADVAALNELVSASGPSGGGAAPGPAPSASGTTTKTDAAIDALTNKLQRFYELVKAPPTSAIQAINDKYDALAMQIEAVGEAEAIRFEALNMADVAEARLEEARALRHEAELRRFDELEVEYQRIAEAAEEAARREIAAKEAAARKQTEAAVFSANSLISTALALNDKLGNASKAGAEKQAKIAKVLAIVQIAISGAVAAARAFADLGPIAGAVAAIAVGGAIAAEALTVKAQPTTFHTGLYDERQATLKRGEVVVPAPTVAAAGGPDAMRRRAEGTGGGGGTVVQNYLLLDGAVIELIAEAIERRAKPRSGGRPLGVAEVS